MCSRGLGTRLVYTYVMSTVSGISLVTLNFFGVTFRNIVGHRKYVDVDAVARARVLMYTKYSLLEYDIERRRNPE